MRSNRKFIGVIGVGVLLSGTAVLWLVGYRHESLPRASAIPPQNGCNPGPGEFCGKLVSYNGGCTPKNCCSSTDYYCYLSHADSPYPFPLVRGINENEHGSCWKSGTAAIDYCLVNECGEATLCSEGTCVIVGSGTKTQSIPIVNVGGSCPPIEE